MTFYFSRTQDTGSGTPITLKVDDKGFYLYWLDQNHEMDLLDIATIRDVRTGQYAKKPKVSRWELKRKLRVEH
jgi:phosphatidylinositol phospholipase C, beta